MNRRYQKYVQTRWMTLLTGLKAITFAAFLAAAAPAFSQAGGAKAEVTRGDAAMKAKDYVQALDAYQKAVAADPSLARAPFQIGWIYNEQKQYAPAVTALRESQRLKADDDNTVFELAYAYHNLKQYGEAAAAYGQALKVRPDHALSLRGLGSTYLALGRKADAVALAKTLQGIDKEKASSLDAEINRTK